MKASIMCSILERTSRRLRSSVSRASQLSTHCAARRHFSSERRRDRHSAGRPVGIWVIAVDPEATRTRSRTRLSSLRFAGRGEPAHDGSIDTSSIAADVAVGQSFNIGQEKRLPLRLGEHLHPSQHLTSQYIRFDLLNSFERQGGFGIDTPSPWRIRRDRSSFNQIERRIEKSQRSSREPRANRLERSSARTQVA